MSKVDETDITATRRIPITMDIVDKDDLIVDGMDGSDVGCSVGIVDGCVEGWPLG